MLAAAGHALAYVASEVEEGAALLSRAINLDANLLTARLWSGWVNLWLGNEDVAIEQFKIALRLSPLDPLIFNAQTGLAFAYFSAGRNEDASSWAATALRQQPKFVGAHLVMMACHAMSGQVKEAREVCARAMQLDPTLRISGFTYRRRPEDIEKLRMLTGSLVCRSDHYWHIASNRYDTELVATEAWRALVKPAPIKLDLRVRAPAGSQRC